MKAFLLITILLASSVILCGCSDIGNENPITPEQMDRERSKQDRGNFNPSNTPPKPGG